MIIVNRSVLLPSRKMQSFHTDSTDNPGSTTRSYVVGAVNTLPAGTCRRIELPNGDELVIYNVNGEYYATDNFCPHRGAPLSDGAVSGHIVECGWHGWRFDVRTGECLTVTEKIRTFSVKVDQGMLLVELA
jgi:nitrite reductase/ring-hydroxylating ferredoxin subunit